MKKETVGGQARAAIAARGYSASELAREAEVDPRSLQRWLKGERGITLETFEALAEVLGLRLVEVESRPRRRRG